MINSNFFVQTSNLLKSLDDPGSSAKTFRGFSAALSGAGRKRRHSL